MTKISNIKQTHKVHLKNHGFLIILNDAHIKHIHTHIKKKKKIVLDYDSFILLNQNLNNFKSSTKTKNKTKNKSVLWENQIKQKNNGN